MTNDQNHRSTADSVMDHASRRDRLMLRMLQQPVNHVRLNGHASSSDAVRPWRKWVFGMLRRFSV